RTDPSDGRVLVSGARDVEQGGEKQGCAQPAIAMRGERTDRPEPAEAAVVAIVSGERSPFAVESARHVRGPGRTCDRVRDLEGPAGTKGRRDRRAQRRQIVGAGRKDMIVGADLAPTL